MNNIDRLISEQVHAWSVKEKKVKRDKQEALDMWPVITISREYGARGRSLAQELGRRIEFKVWDKELLSAIAEESGADKQFLASLDERRRKMIEDALYGAFMGSKHSNTNYFRSLSRVLKTIGAHGKGIIVGRGANYVIKSTKALRVRLISPVEKRVSFVAKNEGISEKKALKMIKSHDTDREDFIRHYFKRESGNAHDFDLVLNGDAFSIEQLADLVLFAYEKKIGKAVPVL
jgi:cytidylate kinase